MDSDARRMDLVVFKVIVFCCWASAYNTRQMNYYGVAMYTTEGQLPSLQSAELYQYHEWLQKSTFTALLAGKASGKA